MQRLEGKTAVVTGGASGIGAGIAHTFAAHGCRVLIGDVDRRGGAEVARSIGPRAAFVHLDVTSDAQWTVAIAEAVELFGGVDVLVNNAGASAGVRRMDKEPAEDFERILRLNVAGVWKGIRSVIPVMSQRGVGSIVNIASIDSYIGVAGMTTYVTTKFGVLGMTKSAALELGDLGIRVNAVHPGVIDTPGLSVLTEEARAQLERSIASQPVKRLGRPEDVALAALFFASDESAYCTGASLVVDGGQIAGRYRDLAE